MARVSWRGDFVKVTFLRQEVMRFKDRWPVSGLRDAAIWFEFDSGGNLVDMGSSRTLRRAEGSGALLALSQDAWEIARRRRRRRSRRSGRSGRKKVGLLGY